MLVVCDFDETAVEQNVARLLLERFGHAGLLGVHAAYVSGNLTFREYQEGAFRAVNADLSELRTYSSDVAKLRPGFADAVRATIGRGGEFHVVSAGLSLYVEPVLQRHGLSGVPVTAVTVRPVADAGGGIRYDYPDAEPRCDPDWAVCKCYPMAAALSDGREVIFVGDGLRSDACAARQATTVFARGRLLKDCRAAGIRARPFDDFYAIADYIRTSRRKPASGQAPR